MENYEELLEKALIPLQYVVDKQLLVLWLQCKTKGVKLLTLKVVKNIYGLSLIDAKHIVDRYWVDPIILTDSQSKFDG